MIDFVQRVSFLLMCFVPDVQCSKAFPYDIGHYLRIYVNSVVAIVFFYVFDIINCILFYLSFVYVTGIGLVNILKRIGRKNRY